MRAKNFLDDHRTLTRRFFVQAGLGSAAVAALSRRTLLGDQPAADEALAALAEPLAYFTPPEEFGTVERGNPLPYTHPEEKLREVGLTRDSWKLEVVADPDSSAVLDNPLSREAGTALDWDGLMRLAETAAVRFLKIMTCNNGGSPLGMGLWEGVPLRDVVWLARPDENVRRVFYWGYHNDDPAQMFRSSLPIGRVLEDPPGEHPVLLCYKLNGELLSGKRGGPVRMLVPDAYGFKSVKWLQRVVLTNAPFANDTYADGNNDIDSWMKTFARFLGRPEKITSGQPIPLTGLAQVGISGLSQVQFWLHPRDTELPRDGPYFAQAPWQPATILPTPERWRGLPDEALPPDVEGFDESGRPQAWPMRYALAHWAALPIAPQPGKYDLRCRTIDARGIAQPLPRPFPKSGRNNIEKVSLEVLPA
jgi:DMSO/TMAO reductase YedYZ molybdopterin-dependent catalytic subunit